MTDFVLCSLNMDHHHIDTTTEFENKNGITCLMNVSFNQFNDNHPGLPTLAYGLGLWMWTTHSEEVFTSKGIVTVYFWYKENRNCPH